MMGLAYVEQRIRRYRKLIEVGRRRQEGAEESRMDNVSTGDLQVGAGWDV